MKNRESLDAGVSRDRSDAGDTLVEVLLAIVILGMASVAILMAFATSISGTAQHRSIATMDTVLRTAAEEAISRNSGTDKRSIWSVPGP